MTIKKDISRWALSCTAGLLLLAPWHQGAAQEKAAELRVAQNGRHLVAADDVPFFYLADTAWAMFHRLNREEVDAYLKDRAKKGFNVIQAVVLAELGGITEPNSYGDMALLDGNPATPNPAYFRHVDYAVRRANEQGLAIGLLPSWGRYWRDGKEQIFDVESAEIFGEYLGKRYRHANLIWILGGDSNVRSAKERKIIDAMARGLRKGDGGRHLISFHPRGPGLASKQLGDAKWLDFYMSQSSHAARDLDTGLYIEHDRRMQPRRPVIDGEPRYEGIPVGFYNQGHDPRLRFDDTDTRQAGWWALLAGAAGHSYGNNNVWQMWTTAREPAIGANRPWIEALDDPGARQAGYLRRFAEAHDFANWEPRQDLILDGSLSGPAKIRAARARDGHRIIVYSPRGEPFTLDLGEVNGAMHNQSWFDPRYGVSYKFRTEQSHGIQAFVPPSSGRGQDWVLVLESQ
ncbi:glycoside hydrolase family 140 protein [Sphingopyxis sp. MWB1]|uniref:glycoside hydrolase family 140 protein n=1 Tax=Sphingopyxis sp. MWB1 TaxID=1537715 RepID=UPI00068E65E9|nr:glycoside hydrolase family 140 protein [Sphingopyxis sp. MWB1]